MSDDPTLSSELAAVSRIKLSTLFWIVSLIVTVSGWGWQTLANNKANEKQDVELEQKVDKDVAAQRFDLLMKRLDELREDIKEIRKEQHEESTRHHRTRRGNETTERP